MGKPERILETKTERFTITEEQGMTLIIFVCQEVGEEGEETVPEQKVILRLPQVELSDATLECILNEREESYREGLQDGFRKLGQRICELIGAHRVSDFGIGEFDDEDDDSMVARARQPEPGVDAPIPGRTTR